MITICGFESMRMIRKRQINAEGCTSAEIFYNIASWLSSQLAHAFNRVSSCNKTVISMVQSLSPFLPFYY